MNFPQNETQRFFDGVVWSREDVLTQMKLNKDVDLIQGGPEDDVLVGTFLGNRIYGGGGNDRLEGKKGDDRLWGEAGDDTYVWKQGDGNDTILDSQGRNVLELAVSPDDVKLSRDDRHLYIVCRSTGERLRIESWYAGIGNKLSEIRFSDGTVWSAEHVDSLLTPIIGTQGPDPLLGSLDRKSVV